jgi:type IV pilus assembly protein PilX
MFQTTLCHSRPQRQSGIVLITAMIFLLVITVLGVSMFRNFGWLERMTGYGMEKQRVLNIAQNTLQYAEWWISQGNGGAGTTCTSLLDADVSPTSVQVCSNALISTSATSTQAQVSVVPWKSSDGTDLGVSYTPANVTVSSTRGAGAVAIKPRLYISPLGMDPSGVVQLYQVSAMAEGGGPDTIAVVQSVYGVKSNVIDAGAL